MDQRSVLFVAYNFPPHGGPGVQRSAKFVKYLPELGWRPLIVTTAADANPVQDPTLLAELPDDLSIYRIPGMSIERMRIWANQYRLGKLIIILNLLLQIPDASRFWAHNTHAAIKQIVSREKPQVVFTTSGPYSSHLIGAWVKKHFDIPWFADFRDPWSKNLLIPYLPGYRRLNRHLERRVLTAADRVACVSEPWSKDLYNNLGQQPEKFLVLPNGYDDADIHRLPVSAPGNRFTLTHLGTFYRNRRPDQLIHAIRLLTSSGRIPASRLRLLFIGKNARRFIPNFDPFEAHDYVPHKELEPFRAQTNAFVLILDTSPQNIGNHSGKLFEYLASNRPILGIVPAGGVAQRLIEETRTGLAVQDDPLVIADAIESLYTQWEAGNSGWSPQWDIIQQYSRRNLTVRLASEFARMIETETDL